MIRDPRLWPLTVAALARECRGKPRTFREWCDSFGVGAFDVVRLVVCCKIVIDEEHPWDPEALLAHHLADRRTIRRWLKRAGLDRKTRPTVAQFLHAQQFVESAELTAQLQQALTRGESRS